MLDVAAETITELRISLNYSLRRISWILWQHTRISASSNTGGGDANCSGLCFFGGLQHSGSAIQIY